MKKVVIIGGSYAAVAAFKVVVGLSIPVDITVIAPSEYTWNNCTSPRLLVEPTRKKETIINLKTIIDNKLEKNSIHNGRFINSIVTDVDLDEHTFTYGEETGHYDFLVIATGTIYESDAFKLPNSSNYLQTFKTIDELAAKIKSAKKIAIIGGGPTGVEVAGELGYEYGTSKKIELFTGSSKPLKALKESNRKSAEEKLTNLNVKVINGDKITDYTESTLTYKGETCDYDIVIPTCKSYPNTDFLPGGVLDDDGYIDVNNHFLLKDYRNVIAFGDVAKNTPKNLTDLLYNQIKVVRSTIYHWFKHRTFKNYSPYKSMLVVPISKKGGVGEVYGISYPSLLIKLFKGNDYGIKRSADFF